MSNASAAQKELKIKKSDTWWSEKHIRIDYDIVTADNANMLKNAINDSAKKGYEVNKITVVEGKKFVVVMAQNITENVRMYENADGQNVEVPRNAVIVDDEDEEESHGRK